MTSPLPILPPLIQQMLVPAFYPHPTADSIRLLQTHISYVLLTGQYAYKIKKPVNFAFADFSTLERRRHFVSEELRLNSHGAPGIYVDVLPISVISGGFRLGDAGNPIEYALKMLQFPQEALFTSLLKRDKVNDGLIDSLARAVADYHRTSRTDEIISKFGQPDRIHSVLNDNYRQTESFIGGPQTSEQFEQTRHFTDDFCAVRSELLQARVAGGFIRECHGDLHLGNICFWQDRVLLFDCIEFNESFRFIDVIQDIAFAIMDLEASNRPDLAWLLLNTYVERTGDWEGLQILPLYLARHAYVRAKVNSLLLNEAEVSDSAKREASELARNYYRQASEYAQERRGRIILVCGLSGAGKSTIARYLSRQLRAVHIRSDAVRKHIARIPLDQRGGPEIYIPAMTAKTYERLLQLGILLARDGFTVILDAKYDLRENRSAVIENANAAGIRLQLVCCVAPLEARRERLLKRRDDISDATAEFLDSQETRFQEFTDAERSLVSKVSTTGAHVPRNSQTEEPVKASFSKVLDKLASSLSVG